MSKPAKPEGKLRLHQYLRDAFAPARCIGCLIEGTWLCSECQQQLTQLPSVEAPARHINAGPYGSEAIRRGVHWLKFKGIKEVAPALAFLLADKLMRINTFSVLRKEAVFIPVPLHPRRERQRGFNQSELIATSLAHIISVEVADVLQRTKATWTQSQLPVDMRGANAADAFTIDEGVFTSASLNAKRYWILVDDVATSGATLDAAAKALEKAKPKNVRIWFATVAHG